MVFVSRRLQPLLHVFIYIVSLANGWVLLKVEKNIDVTIFVMGYHLANAEKKSLNAALLATRVAFRQSGF